MVSRAAQGELEEKFAERFAESQGNFELARDRTQQDLADGVTQIEKEIQVRAWRGCILIGAVL